MPSRSVLAVLRLCSKEAVCGFALPKGCPVGQEPGEMDLTSLGNLTNLGPSRQLTMSPSTLKALSSPAAEKCLRRYLPSVFRTHSIDDAIASASRVETYSTSW